MVLFQTYGAFAIAADAIDDQQTFALNKFGIRDIVMVSRSPVPLYGIKLLVVYYSYKLQLALQGRIKYIFNI